MILLTLLSFLSYTIVHLKVVESQNVPNNLATYSNNDARSLGLNNNGAINMLSMAVPGIPGQDYPIFAEVPETSFSCEGRVEGGFFADTQSRCQPFHICANDGDGLKKFSFLCPNGTLFSQEYFICDWWFNVDCTKAENLYKLNDVIAAERLNGQTNHQRGQLPVPPSRGKIKNMQLAITRGKALASQMPPIPTTSPEQNFPTTTLRPIKGSQSRGNNLNERRKEVTKSSTTDKPLDYVEESLSQPDRRPNPSWTSNTKQRTENLKPLPLSRTHPDSNKLPAGAKQSGFNQNRSPLDQKGSPYGTRLNSKTTPDFRGKGTTQASIGDFEERPAFSTTSRPQNVNSAPRSKPPGRNNFSANPRDVARPIQKLNPGGDIGLKASKPIPEYGVPQVEFSANEELGQTEEEDLPTIKNGKESLQTSSESDSSLTKPTPSRNPGRDAPNSKGSQKPVTSFPNLKPESETPNLRASQKPLEPVTSSPRPRPGSGTPNLKATQKPNGPVTPSSGTESPNFQESSGTLRPVTIPPRQQPGTEIPNLQPPQNPLEPASKTSKPGDSKQNLDSDSEAPLLVEQVNEQERPEGILSNPDPNVQSQSSSVTTSQPDLDVQPVSGEKSVSNAKADEAKGIPAKIEPTIESYSTESNDLSSALNPILAPVTSPPTSTVDTEKLKTEIEIQTANQDNNPIGNTAINNQEGFKGSSAVTSTQNSEGTTLGLQNSPDGASGFENNSGDTLGFKNIPETTSVSENAPTKDFEKDLGYKSESIDEKPSSNPTNLFGDQDSLSNSIPVKSSYENLPTNKDENLNPSPLGNPAPSTLPGKSSIIKENPTDLYRSPSPDLNNPIFTPQPNSGSIISNNFNDFNPPSSTSSNPSVGFNNPVVLETPTISGAIIPLRSEPVISNYGSVGNQGQSSYSSAVDVPQSNFYNTNQPENSPGIRQNNQKPGRNNWIPIVSEPSKNQYKSSSSSIHSPPAVDSFSAPLDLSYGAPQASPISQDEYGAPQASPLALEYGAPQAEPLDGYGAPGAPVVTTQSVYNSGNRGPPPIPSRFSPPSGPKATRGRPSRNKRKGLPFWSLNRG